MTKQIVIAERDNIAALLENGKVSEFFVNKGEILDRKSVGRERVC